VTGENRFELSIPIRPEGREKRLSLGNAGRGKVSLRFDAAKPDRLDVFDNYQTTYRPLEAPSGFVAHPHGPMAKKNAGCVRSRIEFGICQRRMATSRSIPVVVPFLIHAEPLRTWKENLTQLRRLVQLRDAARFGDRKPRSPSDRSIPGCRSFSQSSTAPI
jgi:hypothetical protein